MQLGDNVRPSESTHNVDDGDKSDESQVKAEVADDSFTSILGDPVITHHKSLESPTSRFISCKLSSVFQLWSFSVLKCNLKLIIKFILQEI